MKRYERTPVMTFEEIGRVLGISTEAARMCYRHAIDKLRKRYATKEQRQQSAADQTADEEPAEVR